MEKQNNVPKLRFPEFSDGWKVKKLGEMAEIIMGQSPDGESYNTVGLGFPLINGPVEFTEKYPVKIKWTSKPTKFCQDKDVLFCVRGSTTGRMNIANDKYCIGRGVAAIRANKQSTSLFIELILIRNLEEILSYTTGSTFQNIDSKSLKEFGFQIPTLPEQQKIASFLSTVDEKLQALKKKKSLLETYKKGVMQKLFSQQIRFKDDEGNDFEGWEMKRLGEVSEKKSSNISANKIEDNFGEYIIYGASGILKKVNFYEEENDYVSIIKDGAGVGRIVYCKGKSSVLGTMEIIKPKIRLNTYFLYCLLENIDFTKYITGSTIPHIYFKDYKNEICGIPCLEEQTKIANFLTAIDEKINKVDGQIKQTELWKKGLLQGMFV